MKQCIKEKYDTLVYVFSAGTTGINDEFEYLNFIKEKGCKRAFCIWPVFVRS